MALPQANIAGAANAQVTVYTVPGTAGQATARTAAFNINACALVACKATIWLVPPGASVDDMYKIEAGRPLQETDVIERTGIVASSGYRVIISSNIAAALAVNVWGIEETA